MDYFGFIVLGIVLISCGVLIKKKKWMWLHLGMRKRKLDVDRFVSSIYLVDIIFGILFFVLGGLSFIFYIPIYILSFIVVSFIIIELYIENKHLL